MMKRMLLTVCLFTIVYSCTSDDSQTPDDQVTNFYALTIGNSWEYKNYKYNSNSEAYEDTGVVDAVSIVSAEEISGNTYFKFRRLTTGNEEGITFCNPNGEHFEYLREANGNLIDSEGTIKFTNNDFSQRLLQENSWGDVVEQLVEGNTEVIVESGTFTCLNSERYAITPEGDQLPGLDRFYYADGVGLIYDTTSFISNEIPSIIRRLDAYTVQ